MELAEALKRRHMSRKFTDRPVEKEKLDLLLYAAGRAPQGGNMPVREYVVVTDPRYMKLLRGTTPSFLANSTAAIVICTDLEKALEVMGVQGRDVLSLLDAGAAAENIALQAVELGLGVSFVRSATTEAAKKVLGIPERYRIDIIVGLGYKAKDTAPIVRGQKPTTHLDRYGGMWNGR
jgi:nitroreductase